jgi:hypothetical protein
MFIVHNLSYNRKSKERSNILIIPEQTKLGIKESKFQNKEDKEFLDEFINGLENTSLST